jgi:ABC-2 type transport system ATP-binding protein
MTSRWVTPSRRVGLLVTSVVLLAVYSPTSARAAGGSDHVTPDVGTHTYVTVNKLVAVVDGPTNSHHAIIDTRLYVPNNATALTPQPAILMTHGFGLSKTSAEVVSTADFFARHGYVVLTWTSQGFGKSTGCIRLDSFDYDVKDVLQLVNKVLVPRSDVKSDAHGLVLGMTGGSYGGGITLNVAAMDHRVRAIVPGRTWNSLQFALDPNNRVVPGDPTGFSHQLPDQGVFKSAWTSLFFAVGNAAPIGGLPPDGTSQGGCIQEKLLSGDPAVVAGAPCTGYPSSVCVTFAGTASTGDATASSKQLLAGASVESRIGQLKAATLLLQGQSDTLFNVNEAVATYTELKQRGVPVAMTWNYGGHGGYNSLPGECDVYGGGTTGLDKCYLTLRTLRWFDHYLRGKPLGSFNNFTYFRDWTTYGGAGANDEQYGAASTFPAQQTETLMLSGSTELVAPGTAPIAATVALINPPLGIPASYSESSNFTGPDASPSLGGAPPFDVPGQAVTFTAKAFTTDVVSVGVPSAHVHLSHSSGRDLVVYGKVFDVAPNGSATLIKRLIAPVRVPASDVAKPIDIKLIGFAHQFKKGHAVRLTLATTDQTSYNVKVPDAITVTNGGSDPSTFTLPVSTTGAVPAGHPTADQAGTTPVSSGRGLATTGPSTVLPIVALLVLGAAGAIRRRRPARRST